jgi:hypothetical protein
VTDQAFRRAVFFVAGFDVVGPRFYRLLFKRELKQDSARLQRRLRMVEPAPEQPAAWSCSITTKDGPRPVEIEYHVLTPHELVSPSYRHNALAVAWNWLRVLFAYLRYGVARRVFAASWKTGVVLISVLGLPAVVFAAGATVAGVGLTFAIPGVPPAIAVVFVLAGGFVGLQGYVMLDRGAGPNLLLSSMAVGADQAAGKLPAFEQIVESFARFVLERRAAARWDEILVVGHSSGTIMAVDVMARVLDHIATGGPRLALLTLGSSHGVVTFFRHAARQRAAFARVATAPNVTWIEYFTARDFICLGRRDPIATAGIDLGAKRQTGPLMRRLSISRFYSPERARRLRFNLFDRHFDYLKAGDPSSDYSYFRTVCGATPLAR